MSLNLKMLFISFLLLSLSGITEAYGRQLFVTSVSIGVAEENIDQEVSSELTYASDDRYESLSKDDDEEMSMDENNDIPSVESLIPGTDLYNFVTNPNLQYEGTDVYVINYSDPEYIEREGDPLLIPREERIDPEIPDLVIRVNFKQKTAVITIGDQALDVSQNYFFDRQ
ncbi:MAG: hypothetical protein AAFY33_06760 [Cyanobacteria bacterium J06643_4]